MVHHMVLMCMEVLLEMNIIIAVLQIAVSNSLSLCVCECVSVSVRERDNVCVVMASEIKTAVSSPITVYLHGDDMRCSHIPGSMSLILINRGANIEQGS